MRIYKETTVKDYGAWAGAEDFVNRLTDEEANSIDMWLDECWAEMSETELNDLLWFDSDSIIEDVLFLDIDEFWSR